MDGVVLLALPASLMDNGFMQKKRLLFHDADL